LNNKYVLLGAVVLVRKGEYHGEEGKGRLEGYLYLRKIEGGKGSKKDPEKDKNSKQDFSRGA